MEVQEVVPWHTEYLSVGERMCSWKQQIPLAWRTVIIVSRGEAVSSQVGRVGQAPAYSSLNAPVLFLV